jgi:hypothetical protein
VPWPTSEPGGARSGGVPDTRVARGILGALADVASGRAEADALGAFASFPGGRTQLAAWLARHDMAPLGLAASRPVDPALAATLTQAALGAAAANLHHFATLDRLERRFAASGVPLVLLKGASVAGGAYADASFRPMTDLDIWVRDADMPRAMALVRAEGFRQEPGLATRPPTLQRHSGGEIVFRAAHGGHGLVELHFSPFQGWWIQRTASPDIDGVWSRSEPAGIARHARRLAAEDAILQTAFHVVVNQFGQAPVRGLMDLAVISRSCRVDWTAVADRAIQWRLAAATWLALDTADRLIGVPGSAAAVERLLPDRARRALLRSFVTPASVLAGRNLGHPVRRHPFMLALADRRRDGARLVGRALWPERWWVEARHGRGVGRLGHVRELLRRGDV